MASVALFPKPEPVGPREWGEETLLVLSPGKYTLKKIFMKRGSVGGLQKHHLKDEAGYVVSGAMLVWYDDGTGNLVGRKVVVGQSFHFPAGCVHQAKALSDVVYIEASTPHFNDRVHCEADYGIEKEDGGLPSTELSDVETR